MSRAVPASYSEYLYTNPTNLICDGGIMPLRNSSDPTSTWYKNCLRGEDLIFFNEAFNMRAKVGGSSWDRTPSEQISSSRLAEFRTSAETMINGNMGQSLTGIPPAGELQDYYSAIDYLRGYLNIPTNQYSSGDTYTVLDSAQIMNLFKDIKQLNYGICQSGMLCPYRFNYSCDVYVYDIDNRPGYQPADPYTYTDTYNIWYESEYYRWYDQGGYPGNVEVGITETCSNIKFSFTMRNYTNNHYNTCVEIIPYAVFSLYNYGRTSYISSDGSGGDYLEKYGYACVPLKSSFTDMLNGGVINVTSTEIENALNTAYSVTNMTKNAAAIPVTPASGHETERSANSWAILSYMYYLVHFKYCTLENVTIQ